MMFNMKCGESVMSESASYLAVNLVVFHVGRFHLRLDLVNRTVTFSKHDQLANLLKVLPKVCKVSSKDTSSWVLVY